MLHNAYLLAKIGADISENERKFGEILPKIGNYPTGSLPATQESPGPKTTRSGVTKLSVRTRRSASGTSSSTCCAGANQTQSTP